MKGNPLPLDPKTNTPDSGSVGVGSVLLVEVLFCLGRLQRGVLRPNTPLIPPTRFPRGMAEQRNKLPQKTERREGTQPSKCSLPE